MYSDFFIIQQLTQQSRLSACYAQAGKQTCPAIVPLAGRRRNFFQVGLNILSYSLRSCVIVITVLVSELSTESAGC